MKNAKNFPKVYYGMHMEPGVAEYKGEDGEPYRIFLNEETLKKMDPSYAGKPVYVRHVEEVNLQNIQAEADGYVSESFYNKSDGKHWVKFIAVSDLANEMISKGWALSNSYKPTKLGAGGRWHDVEYSKEILDGEYEHLAIVPDPRYEHSKILTCEDFKAYNEKKDLELKKLANSKGEKKMSVFTLFKKTKVENSELEKMTVRLPKSGKEISIEKLINDADKKMHQNDEEEHEKQDDKKHNDDDDKKMANEEHHVDVDGKKMKINELVGKHLELKQAYDELMKEHEALKSDKKNDDDAEESDEEIKKKALEIAEHEEEEMEEGAEKEAAKKKNSKNFESLKHAPKYSSLQTRVVDLSIDKVARGRERYGSK